MIELPWSKSTQDKLDVARAEQILDEDHYDLQKVKKRILEYLAVRKLKKDMKGPILCFVGPPGVGKTSLGTLHRPGPGAQIRAHLAGRRARRGRDPGTPAHLRRRPARPDHPGHSRRAAPTTRSSCWMRWTRSAPISAAIPPRPSWRCWTRNRTYSFSDHYLDVPFDLSKVMFITTANVLDPIPPALRDRMEVMELPGLHGG